MSADVWDDREELILGVKELRERLQRRIDKWKEYEPDSDDEEYEFSKVYGQGQLVAYRSALRYLEEIFFGMGT